ncbi:phosphoesterase [Cellulomonas sp. A375-1]|uniref:Phosphoesterase n=1 Tax=Cellulomonas gelida TaxID=1712 RepID=A0A4Y3KFZ3_9CELL|nr:MULTISPECIES: 2'-5' RNA ligase family protein [Cellulomonas]KMM47338.1 phosphoesterase [Cellulomonas sp. A375-1]MCR6705862.1 2'-5' RNA ligase family protein [Cellulomonas sp.]GEA83391.1 phosphoesterase [Cellulomonas gelida]GGL14234.1 phosphoesterase [Cellulomonas gelida]
MKLPELAGDQVIAGVAITVPEPYGAQLQEARARLGDPWAAFIPPHITLLGPTAMDPADVSRVEEHLRGVAASHAPFVVRLRGTATFRPVSPVAFVQVADGIAGCEQLEAAVRQGPLAQELRFHYHPHVTVAHELSDEQLDHAMDELADFDASFVVTRFHCYLRSDDEVWRPHTEYRLTGRAQWRPSSEPGPAA